MQVEDQLNRLDQWFQGCESALVAYSGGVDSALVMAMAHRRLGDRALACIGVSPSYPAQELQQAIDLARATGAQYRKISTEEYLDPNYAANPRRRCYYCKNELYGRLRRLADQQHWQRILDGTNASDLSDDRPGRAAATEHGVRSPLAELGLGKDQVRALARHLGLPVWNKPSMACLASRVPHGTPITPQLLQQVEAAEEALRAQGFQQFRVRHHGDLARIELLPEDFSRACQQRNELISAMRQAGYRYVCLDLAGYRSGGGSTTNLVDLRIEGRS